MKRNIALWKWILLFILSLALGLLGMGLSEAFHHWTGSAWGVVLGSAILLALYYGAVRLIERQPVADLPLRRLAPDMCGGLLIGALFMAAVVGLIAAFGCAHFSTPGDATGSEMLTALLVGVGVAVREEVLFRGILFRWIDERWGLVPALIVSGLLFGFLHLANPGATVWSSIAISIEAGLMLGAAYKWSGTLWLPIGIHWAWNYVQGSVFGISVSGGEASRSIIKTIMDGPELITGGAFGAEASIITVILGAALSALFLYLYSRKH